MDSSLRRRLQEDYRPPVQSLLQKLDYSGGPAPSLNSWRKKNVPAELNKVLDEAIRNAEQPGPIGEAYFEDLEELYKVLSTKKPRLTLKLNNMLKDVNDARARQQIKRQYISRLLRENSIREELAESIKQSLLKGEVRQSSHELLEQDAEKARKIWEEEIKRRNEQNSHASEYKQLGKLLYLVALRPILRQIAHSVCAVNFDEPDDAEPKQDKNKVFMPMG